MTRKLGELVRVDTLNKVNSHLVLLINLDLFQRLSWWKKPRQTHRNHFLHAAFEFPTHFHPCVRSVIRLNNIIPM